MTREIGTFLPIALIVCSNLFYNIAAKATPSGANALASLVITYVVAALSALVMMRFQTGSFSIDNFKGINWTAILLAASIVALEIGYILAYRAGWNISVCSLIANITLAVLLVIFGVFLYHENISPKQIGGMVLCLGGLLLINLK
ncbi:MAG: EamA family transporter [Candidatus Fimivivens sp.]|nr:EamA family transporter [Candidatus Fimivivens sp.]